MISEQFVWVWLPGTSQPVVCGRVWHEGNTCPFQYGRSYLERKDAVPLFDIPLEGGTRFPSTGMHMHGILRDALPDAWGRYVIQMQLTGRSAKDADSGEISEFVYMRLSSSNRFGAIDFQDSAVEYNVREDSATLDELAQATYAIEMGEPLSPALEAALMHGTSIGGARPKATLVDGQGIGWIAKFGSSSDGGMPRIKYEALALYLAQLCGVDTVDFQLSSASGRDVLLVRRFDRDINGGRYMAVSALTILELDEMMGRYATYPDFLDQLRTRTVNPRDLGPRLFRRIAVNIALGNTDDHARNHAALWDGTHLLLAPAYDLDPCRTHGWDANQAMAYGRKGERTSNLGSLVTCAPIYDLTGAEAKQIVDEVVSIVNEKWSEATQVAELTQSQSARMRGTQILNPSVSQY